MIQFNELRITPDSQHLIIDVAIEDQKYYDNVTIDQIIIDTQDTYSQNGPSSKPIYTYTVDPIHDPRYPYPDDKIKHVRLCLDKTDLKVDLSGNLFFVYVVADGIPAPSTPCGMDENIRMATVCNLYNIYQSAMNYVRELEAECSIPSTFIDFILRLKAFTLSIKTGNYLQAIKYWNNFYKYRTVKVTSKCGCNG